MISPSFGISTDYSGSVLRFGLVEIKPIEVVETVKRFGIKFKRTFRTFESLQPSQSFSDFVTLNNEIIFAKIDIPDWFEARKLVEIYSQRSIESYEKDTELKKAIEELRKSKKERIGKPLLSFVRFVMNRFESKREQFLETEAERFLTSNFPLSFYKKFVVLHNTFYDFLKVLENLVRIHEFRARYSRGFLMYSRYIEAMKREIRPILDQMDTCLFLFSCLKKYVTVWNAKSYDDIYEGPEFLDIKKLDYSNFEQLNNDFKMKLAETRKFLLNYDPNILQKELKLENDPTAKMFGALLMLPSSSLSIER